MLNQDLEMRLRNLANLPSPPGVAAQIIQMAQDPDVELETVAKLITHDPSLAAKILRVANSPLYAQRRKCNNLRQALIVLGLNAAVTLSLSFSLVSELKRARSNGLDYPAFWRRSLMAAIVSRAIAEYCELNHREELFLAGLLQDIGMMALDRAMPEHYADARCTQADHGALSGYECERIGVDHAAVGAWLLSEWNIPEFIQNAVASSHTLYRDNAMQSDGSRGRQCIALSGIIADLWLGDGDEAQICAAAAAASISMQLDRDDLSKIMGMISGQIPDLGSMFDVDLLDATQTEMILERARETLMIRNLQSLQEASELRKTTRDLQTRANTLEQENRRDRVTGICNRKHLDELLKTGFRNARRFGWPLSIAFIDLDHFKHVNDTYGHVKGDAVLHAAASLLVSNVRGSDTVGRYGGEEFVIVLPGADDEGVQVVTERLLCAFRNAATNPDWIEDITVTASIGTATLESGAHYADVTAFVEAADRALYVAKGAGRNRASHAVPEEKQAPAVKLASVTQ